MAAPFLYGRKFLQVWQLNQTFLYFFNNFKRHDMKKRENVRKQEKTEENEEYRLVIQFANGLI